MQLPQATIRTYPQKPAPLSLAAVAELAKTAYAEQHHARREPKVAIAQMRVYPNNPEKNFQRMCQMIADAKAQGAHVVVFPELCVGGYLLGDPSYYEASVIAQFESYNERLREQSCGITLVWGNVYADTAERQRARGIETPFCNKDGRQRLYNAMFVASDGEWASRAVEPRSSRGAHVFPKGVQIKTLLPNYTMFDDERYFTSLLTVAQNFWIRPEDLVQPFVITVDGEKRYLGGEICEDAWFQNYFVGERAFNIGEVLLSKGADFIVNLSASPYYLGKRETRRQQVERHFETVGAALGKPFYYVNQVSMQNNGKNDFPFDGSSFATNKHGKIVALMPELYQEGLLVVEHTQGPEVHFPATNRNQEIVNTIVHAIRETSILGVPGVKGKWVVAASGGADSTLVLMLLALAVGPDNVLAVNLPTRINSDKTKENAYEVCRKLGIPCVDVPIQDDVEQNRRSLMYFMEQAGDLGCPEKTIKPLVEENIQAKIRQANILSNAAQQFGRFYTANGNLLEIFFGYATLLGDWNGVEDFIASLTKAELFEVARYLNDEIFGCDIFPLNLLPNETFHFDTAPGPELEDNVSSPLKFGYYDPIVARIMDHEFDLEKMLQMYIDGTLHSYLGIPAQLLERYKVNTGAQFVKDAQWIFKQKHSQMFKRVQGTPLLCFRKNLFGYTERESIGPFVLTDKARELSERIIEQRINYIPADVSTVDQKNPVASLVEELD